MMSERIKKIKRLLEEKNLETFFISDKDNVTYLSNFTGIITLEREAFLIITKKNNYLLTYPTRFGLYKNVDNLQVLNITSKKNLASHLKEIIIKEKISSLGYEKDNLTVSELESLRSKLPVKFVSTEKIIENLRMIKEKEEIEAISKAAKITDRAFTFILRKIKKGVSEKNLALDLEFFLKGKAGDVSFPPIVAFNENAAIPHYIPDNKKYLINNSLILLDFGAKVDNYCSDMTRVVFFGNPTNQQAKVYQTVLIAQKKAIEKIRPGVRAFQVDNIARRYIKKSGFPPYPHGLGHGVGLAIHEEPRLKPEHKDRLRENMVVTVEPGIYLEGKFGVRIEDLVVVKKKGIDILSCSSKNLTII